jgi:beta-lactamase class D
MSPAGKRSVLIGGIVVMVGIVAAAVVILSNGGGAPSAAAADPGPPAATPTAAIQGYLDSLASADTYGAAEMTDDVDASYAVLRDTWKALHPTKVRTTLAKVSGTGGKAIASYTMAWTLAGHVWSYTDTCQVVWNGTNWRLHWTPAVLHPKLRTGQRLALATDAEDQTAVVDRDGKPLVVTGSGGRRLADPQTFGNLRSALLGQVSATTANDVAVHRVDAQARVVDSLYGASSGRLTPRRSTLSTAVQKAAVSAVNGYRGKAVILAMQPSTGGIVAAAQNAAAGGSPFSGLYAPGSTFKIVTATAAIENGVATRDSMLPCPLTEQIGTRTISNEGFDLGTTTMHHAFARSCNTTFGKLASQLPADGLVKAADQYGLNADFSVPGLTTELGKVVPAADPNEQVEDGIGQGTVQVSPFGEVVMAATVAAGHTVTPRLWADAATGVTTGYTAPSGAVLASLRSMMREVVTGGTATGLAHSGQVYGKTGTAQFGSGDEAHGWFVGYRGDLAFVVFLEGANDSHPAVTLGAQFLAAPK